MKHILRPRTIIVVLLLVCGGLISVILRQRTTLDQFDQYAESDKHNSLAYVALALGNARLYLTDLASKPRAPDDLSRDLERAVAYLEQAQIHMDAYQAVQQRSDEQSAILFDGIVFQEYKSALYPIIRRLERQDAATPEQRATLAAIDHDLGILHDVVFDHVIHGQDAANRQDGRLNDQSPPRLSDSLLAITPTLKLNGVRHLLGLFPSILPQEDRASGVNHISLTLGASTTCAEVDQPVTFTLDLERYDPDKPPVSLESLDIFISGNGRQERWSAAGGAPKPGQPALAAGESRSYEWVWTASAQFSNTTVQVEAQAKLPQDGPKPTPDPNGLSQDNPVMVDLKLGIGALTQTSEEQISLHHYPTDEAPRTLPCAEMVR